MHDKYWDAEEPETFDISTNVFRYYAKSGRLHVSKPNYLDKETGLPRPGKTVTINLAALSEYPDVVEKLIEILRSI